MRLTTSPSSCAECHEIWEPKPPGTLWATLGLLRDCFTFTFYRNITLSDNLHYSWSFRLLLMMADSLGTAAISICHLSLSTCFNSASLGYLTLILLTWRIWLTPNNASKWQMGFNSAFKGLKKVLKILSFSLQIHITSDLTSMSFFTHKSYKEVESVVSDNCQKKKKVIFLYNNILTIFIFLYPIILCNFLGPKQAFYFCSFGP